MRSSSERPCWQERHSADPIVDLPGESLPIRLPRDQSSTADSVNRHALHGGLRSVVRPKPLPLVGDERATEN